MTAIVVIRFGRENNVAIGVLQSLVQKEMSEII